jgi:hypothetical protein
MNNNKKLVKGFDLKNVSCCYGISSSLGSCLGVCTNLLPNFHLTHKVEASTSIASFHVESSVSLMFEWGNHEQEESSNRAPVKIPQVSRDLSLKKCDLVFYFELFQRKYLILSQVILLCNNRSEAIKQKQNLQNLTLLSFSGQYFTHPNLQSIECTYPNFPSILCTYPSAEHQMHIFAWVMTIFSDFFVQCSSLSLLIPMHSFAPSWS